MNKILYLILTNRLIRGLRCKCIRIFKKKLLNHRYQNFRVGYLIHLLGAKFQTFQKNVQLILKWGGGTIDPPTPPITSATGCSLVAVVMEKIILKCMKL